jgi:hypothetical protein
MDLAVRTLREGIPDGVDAAPLLLLCDALAMIGGPALLRQVCAQGITLPWGLQIAFGCATTFDHLAHAMMCRHWRTWHWP